MSSHGSFGQHLQVSATAGGSADQHRFGRLRYAFGQLALFCPKLQRSMAVRADRQSGLCNAGQRPLQVLTCRLPRPFERAGFASASRLYQRCRPVSGSLRASVAIPTASNGRAEQLQRLGKLDQRQTVLTFRISRTAALFAAWRVVSSERCSRIRLFAGCPIFPALR
jgi:hypothetical protein